MAGTLYLLPNLLYLEGDYDEFVPSSVRKVMHHIDGLIGESPKEARRFLKRFTFADQKTFRDIPIALLNRHEQDIPSLLAPLEQGQTWGLVSDAGLPVLADPGSDLVFAAKKRHISVRVIMGPCAIIQALMLSGLLAQRFSFHGYIDRNIEEHVSFLEKRSKEDEGATQIFMETPYRNDAMLSRILAVLGDKTFLSIAVDLTYPEETVLTQSVYEWKKKPLPSLAKREVVFLLQVR